MRENTDSLRGPITFLSAVLLLEGILALLAGAGHLWSGILLFVVLSTLQIVTLILLWFVFRLMIRVNDRLKVLEKDKTEK